MRRFRPALGLAVLAAVFGPDPAVAQDPGLVSMPVEFEINGRPAGQVVVRARRDLSEPSIQGASLKAAVGERLASGISATIQALPDEYIALAELRRREIIVTLDLERLVVVLQAPERARAVEAGRGTFRMGAATHLRPESRLPEATFSAYTNLRVQDTLRAGGRGTDQPLSADMLHVFNLRGWALSANTLYSGRRAIDGALWRLGDVSLTRDDPGRALRWTVGDLSSPVGTLQAGTRLAGISVGREFTLQPYENYRPTGTADFRLEEAATVEVYLNGARMRTLRLEPGTYNLEDFNLAAGANDLALRITSASGRFEEVNLTRFTARTLLRRGLSEFALSAGLPMAAPGPDTVSPGGGLWQAKHYAREPVISGFWRHGVSDTLTAEINAQGAEYWQRVAAGLDLAGPAGVFAVHGAVNRHRDAPGAFAGVVSWEQGLGAAGLRLSSAYTGAGFVQTQPLAIEPGRLAWSHAATLSAPLPGGIDLTASAFHQTLRDGPAAWGALGRVTRRVGAFTVSLSVQSRRAGERTDTGGFLSVAWNRQPALAARAVLGAGDASVNPGSTAEVNYTRRDGSRFTFLHAGWSSSDEGDRYTGGIRHQDTLVLGELVHRQVHTSVFGQEQRSTETVGTLETALVFADGAWGVTRRVDDAFALITTHRRWRDVRLGINPAFGGFEHDVRPPLHAAVLGQLPVYRETTAFIQTVASDQVLENNDFIFFPGYRRGTRVVIGSDAIYTLRGTLLDPSGEPLAYRALTLTGPGGASAAGFTNIAGRFVIGPLAEGRWRIIDAGTGAWVEVVVAGEATFIRLETLRLTAAE